MRQGEEERERKRARARAHVLAPARAREIKKAHTPYMLRESQKKTDITIVREQEEGRKEEKE